MPVYVGVDFHVRTQTVCWCDTADGVLQERTLDHRTGEVAAFYSQLPASAVVGLEVSGYALWFHRLIQQQGHRLLVGDAHAIRQFARRRQKNDRRDAALLLDLLLRGDFPAVHLPAPASREVLQLLHHRQRLVRTRTLLKNSLHALALNYRLRLGPRLFTVRGRAQLAALPLSTTEAQQRGDALDLLNAVQGKILAVEKELEAQGACDPRVVRLRTHPGVGPLTALAFVHTLEPVTRFARASQVAAYCGLDPQEHSSGDTQRYGHISKQGNRLLRHLLTEAAHTAVRCGQDLELKRFFFHLVRRKKNAGVAIVAVARKLALRLYLLLRDEIDYHEFRRRGRDAGRARETQRPSLA